MSNSKRREANIAFLNRFNVDTFQNLRSWSDARLKEGVAFVNAEIGKASR